MSYDTYYLNEDKIIDYNINNFPVVPLAEMDEESRKEFWATLALRHCRHLGPRTRARLLKFYGSAFCAFEDQLNWQKIGISATCVRELGTNKWREKAAKEWQNALKLNASILLWHFNAYPDKLRELPDAPALLYCVGDITLLKSPALAIVGSRNASETNMGLAAYFAKALSSCGISIISGMARGIDFMAHTAALECVGKSIGVLGTGIDIAYPSINARLYEKMSRDGLLVTEFPPATNPEVYNFPIRNRIISGLSIGVIVVEAAERSGSLITAQQALEQNREVFAIPGEPLSMRSRGCQNLVRQGAHPVFNVDDVLGEIEDELKNYKIHLEQNIEKNFTNIGENESKKIALKTRGQQNKISVPPPEKESKKYPLKELEKVVSEDKSEIIVRLLKAEGPKNVDELAYHTGICLQELNSLLTGMEIMGQIRRLPGAKYDATD